MGLMKRAARRRGGMAMVEMVFVLPLLLLLVFAIAEFGFMFSRWLTLSNAVREGARELVVFDANCDSGAKADEARLRVQEYAQTAGSMTIPDGHITVTGACDSGNPGEVSAFFPVTLNVPYMSDLGTINLTYTSRMRNE